ncbi:hypothetical protein EV14_0778 [Prochlorococcus sp. MIT 0703]|nr:hypothetical protein EV14_0778 [Prochlorococcus sp. MIT 0703]
MTISGRIWKEPKLCVLKPLNAYTFLIDISTPPLINLHV